MPITGYKTPSINYNYQIPTSSMGGGMGFGGFGGGAQNIMAGMQQFAQFQQQRNNLHAMRMMQDPRYAASVRQSKSGGIGRAIGRGPSGMPTAVGGRTPKRVGMQGAMGAAGGANMGPMFPGIASAGAAMMGGGNQVRGNVGPMGQVGAGTGKGVVFPGGGIYGAGKQGAAPGMARGGNPFDDPFKNMGSFF